ncbi:hypothetical protein STEG23_004647 [Scotinomys teguina]
MPMEEYVTFFYNQYVTFFYNQYVTFFYNQYVTFFYNQYVTFFYNHIGSLMDMLFLVMYPPAEVHHERPNVPIPTPTGHLVSLSSNAAYPISCLPDVNWPGVYD